MKKFFCVFLVFMLVFALAILTSAESVATTTAGEGADSTDAVQSEKVDYGALARQFAEYIQSGEAPEELVDSMIAMGEEMKQMKEEGYTLKERLLQLVSPEHILTTATAFALVVCGIVMLILKKKQRNSELDINAICQSIAAILVNQENAAKESAEQKKKDASELEECRKQIEGIKGSVEHLGDGSLAVAKMVKDVFLSSRTLDADGKQLMVKNFNEATKLLNGGKDDQ